MSSKIKGLLKIFGTFLGVLSIIFVGYYFYEYSSEIDLNRFSIFHWLVLSFLALSYAMANIFLAVAWWCLLRFYGLSTKPSWAVTVFGVSQLAKYVPGNIFHMAGRQALGLSAGLPAIALAKSIILELAAICLVGTLFSVLLIPLVVDTVSTALSLFIFTTLCSFIFITLSRLFGYSIACAFINYLLFLIAFGGIATGSLLLISPYALLQVSMPTLIGVFVAAWLIGLITPGAPAGAGMRELVLIFLLGNVLTESDLIIALIVVRAITVAGDFLLFLGVSLSKLIGRTSSI